MFSFEPNPRFCQTLLLPSIVLANDCFHHQFLSLNLLKLYFPSTPNKEPCKNPFRIWPPSLTLTMAFPQLIYSSLLQIPITSPKADSECLPNFVKTQSDPPSNAPRKPLQRILQLLTPPIPGTHPPDLNPLPALSKYNPPLLRPAPIPIKAA